MAIIRRLLQVGLLVLTLVVGVAAIGVIVTQTAWFRDWLRGFIVRQGDQYLNGKLTIGHLGGNIFFGIDLQDITVSQNGEPVITLKDARISYSVLQLMTRNLIITSLRLDQPVIHMRKSGGAWDLSELVKKQSNTQSGSSMPVSMDDIIITGGSFVFDDEPVGTSGVAVPRELNRLDARLSFESQPNKYTVDISKISFRGQSPPFGLNDLSGKIAVNGSDLHFQKVAIRTAASEVKIDGAVFNYANAPSLDVRATSEKFDFREMASIVPALARISLQPAFDISAKGPLNDLHVNLDVRSKAGLIAGNIVADAAAPNRSVAGIIHLRNFNLAAVLNDRKMGSDITGQARVNVRMVTAGNATNLYGTYDVQAEKVAALGYAANDVNLKGRIDGSRMAVDAKARVYGGQVTAAGVATLPMGNSRLGFDMKGIVRSVDLRRLPRSLKMPAVATNLNVDYHVSDVANLMKGDALMHKSTLGGATISDGTRASFTYGRGQASYSAEGAIAGLDLQRIGQQFNIASLKADRFASNVNGRFAVNGSGTKVATMQVNANGALTNSTLVGMTVPQTNFTATLANGKLQAKANGEFNSFDPGRLSGSDNLKGNLAGSFNVDVGLANLGAPAGTSSMLDDVSFNGQLALKPSNVAGLQIDKANFDGSFGNRRAEIRQLYVNGPDLQVKTNGGVTFTDQGESQLKYSLATPSLDRLAKLIGNTALQGAISVDGEVTGNLDRLRTTGTLKGANLGYGSSQALNMTSRYDVTVPNLDPKKAIVGAVTNATFVTLAGQQINEVTATTAYVNEAVDFKIDLKQPSRTLTASGNALLHTEHSEVHLRNFGLQASGFNWQVAPGTEPTVQYGGGRINVKDVRLLSGSQEMAANGTLGPDASNLVARISNFNLANVDALLLTNRGLGGTLNAEATITGPTSAMNVAGKFSVSGGAFQKFTYQSLNGTVNYAKERVALDVRLQENPQAWVTANGSIPMAAFSAHPSPREAAEPVNLKVQSSVLDLGLIQGLTTAIQNAKGTAQFNVDVTGTAANPVANGALDVQNGSFKVVPTGVNYLGFNSHIVLQPDRVTVQNLTITDNHKATLSMTGDLALHERQLGGVNVKVKAKDFKIIDNELGNLRFDSNLGIGGEIRAPRITGNLAVSTGTINLDKVLDLATSSAYSTSAEAVPATAGGQPASQPIGQPVNQPASQAANAPVQPGTASEKSHAATVQPQGASNAAAFDVHVTVPGDLVIKGNDIRVGQSSMGLGNVNLTLGGDMKVQKAPGAPISLIGQVETIRGTYDFQGRRFDIQRGGGVKFEGPDMTNPVLDITATRLITGVETTVHVGGTAKRPELTLSSNPPLEQADILSLIIFGQPSNQLGEGQQVSLAQRASTIAGGFVAGKLAQSIGNALNLDTFEIQTGSDTGEGGATVTVGEQVGQRLYVKLRQGVGSDSTSEFVIDYQLTNFLRFESIMSQGGSPTRNIMNRVQQSGADLIFLFSY